KKRLAKTTERLIAPADGGGMTTTAAPRTAASQRKDKSVSAPRLRATPRWWTDAGGVAAGLSPLVVTALWVSNRGVQEVRGGGPGAAAVGVVALAAPVRVTGCRLGAAAPVVDRWRLHQLATGAGGLVDAVRGVGRRGPPVPGRAPALAQLAAPAGGQPHRIG